MSALVTAAVNAGISATPATGIRALALRGSLSVVLGQDLSEVAEPIRDGALADLAAGDWTLGNGYREAAGWWLAHLPL